MSYPRLFIGQAVPSGWDTDYPTFILRSVDDVREFVGTYGQVGVDFIVGIDLKEVDIRAVSALLKVLEESFLKINLRMNEPVPDTILSRMVEVHKKERIEMKSITEMLVGTYSIIGQKIVGL